MWGCFEPQVWRAPTGTLTPMVLACPVHGTLVEFNIKIPDRMSVANKFVLWLLRPKFCNKPPKLFESHQDRSRSQAAQAPATSKSLPLSGSCIFRTILTVVDLVRSPL